MPNKTPLLLVGLAYGASGASASRIRPYPYSVGYVNQEALSVDPAVDPDRCWATIMAYGTQCWESGGFNYATDILRFSNPDLTYNGDPTGVPGDEPSASVDGPADARRSLNETRRIVANFRRAPCLRDGARIHLQAHNGQYLAAERSGGGAVNADLTAAGPWETFGLLARRP